jgi:hypothetical protein
VKAVVASAPVQAASSSLPSIAGADDVKRATRCGSALGTGCAITWARSSGIIMRQTDSRRGG